MYELKESFIKDVLNEELQDKELQIGNFDSLKNKIIDIYVFNIENLLSIPRKNKKKKNRFYCKNNNYRIYTLNLLPYELFKVCPKAGYCKEICVGVSKQGIFQYFKFLLRTIYILKIDKSKNYTDLKKEIYNRIKYYKNKSEKLYFRLNNYSDICWEDKLGFEFYNDLYEKYKNKVYFYDYTKIKNRFIKYMIGEMPSNYFLTYSYDKKNHNDYIINNIINNSIEIKKPISIAFIVNFNLKSKKEEEKQKEKIEIINNLKKAYENIDIIDGDECDIRVLDLNNPKPIKAVLLEYNPKTGLSRNEQNEDKYYLNLDELREKLNRLNDLKFNISNEKAAE